MMGGSDARLIRLMQLLHVVSIEDLPCLRQVALTLIARVRVLSGKKVVN